MESFCLMSPFLPWIPATEVPYRLPRLAITPSSLACPAGLPPQPPLHRLRSSGLASLWLRGCGLSLLRRERSAKAAALCRLKPSKVQRKKKVLKNSYCRAFCQVSDLLSCASLKTQHGRWYPGETLHSHQRNTWNSPGVAGTRPGLCSSVIIKVSLLCSAV